MVVGTALGWGDAATVALAAGLAFALGHALSLLPLLRAGLGVRAALGLAVAADTASISAMELVDNAVMPTVPGAMDAGLADPLFRGKLAVAPVLAAAAAFPVNRWLIARGRGHVAVHVHHGHHHYTGFRKGLLDCADGALTRPYSADPRERALLARGRDEGGCAEVALRFRASACR